MANSSNVSTLSKVHGLNYGRSAVTRRRVLIIQTNMKGKKKDL